MSEQQKSIEIEPEEAKISPAELKKRAKAEKQARRAAQKEQQGGPAVDAPSEASGAVNGRPKAPEQVGGAAPQHKPKQQQQKAQQKQVEQGKKEAGGQQTALPTRSRAASQSVGQETTKKPDSKKVESFSHLYAQSRRSTMEGISKDVHPAVLALGLQLSSYEICGSTARCVAMLLAFKEAIQSYTTPGGTSLARHMTSHYLSPQIDYLKSCRPIAESMGNAIRWLKKMIVEIDPSTPEHEAKKYLCENVDRFIQERITVTDQAIASSASQQIKDGSVVLTYAKSSLVQKTLLQAHAQGTRFRVVVVDSRPLFEGKKLALPLMNAGLQVEYCHFSALPQAISDATVVLLGAHSMLSNGCLQSRVGTASVALAAHLADIPVLVCCESVKFSGKAALDSVVLNELAPAEELFVPERSSTYVPTAAKEGKSDAGEGKRTLRDYKDIPNLQLLNLLYDVTPAKYINMVICEYGSVPPSSVPVVHRLANEGI